MRDNRTVIEKVVDITEKMSEKVSGIQEAWAKTLETINSIDDRLVRLEKALGTFAQRIVEIEDDE